MLCAVPMMAVGATSRNKATTIMHRRPSVSATTPMTGAVTVTASVVALTVRLTADSVAWK